MLSSNRAILKHHLDVFDNVSDENYEFEDEERK